MSECKHAVHMTSACCFGNTSVAATVLYCTEQGFLTNLSTFNLIFEGVLNAANEMFCHNFGNFKISKELCAFTKREHVYIKKYLKHSCYNNNLIQKVLLRHHNSHYF